MAGPGPRQKTLEQTEGLIVFLVVILGSFRIVCMVRSSGVLVAFHRSELPAEDGLLSRTQGAGGILTLSLHGHLGGSDPSTAAGSPDARARR